MYALVLVITFTGMFRVCRNGDGGGGGALYQRGPGQE